MNAGKVQDLLVTQSRVLVLDDDTVHLKLMQAMLGQLGVKSCNCTSDAVLALSVLAAGECDVLLLDLNMPKTSGLEFIMALGSVGFKGSLVLVSGHDSRVLEAGKDLARSCGHEVLGVIQKPVEIRILRQMLETHRGATKPGQSNAAVPRLALVTFEELQAELEGKSDNLRLVYQPKYHMDSGRIAGYEVLARWNRDGILLPPGCFIQVAQETGQIHELSMLIYRKALVSNRQLHELGFSVAMAVNLSIQTLCQEGIVERILSMAHDHSIDTSLITIEITEDQIYGSIQDYLDKLMRLIFGGVKLAIDDFGTGQSSLVQLRTIPFSEMKIDRLFVHKAVEDHRSAALFEASVKLARHFGMTVVAEGGETREDWDFARSLGCDLFQGYYTSFPLGFDKLSDLLLRDGIMQKTAAEGALEGANKRRA
jgi:EAL domain-containing protein (putative c-di-GMP-specific phosphodiesterase class I)